MFTPVACRLSPVACRPSPVACRLIPDPWDIFTPVKPPVEIAPATGKLGILLVGLGAVSTTVIAGVHAIRKNLAPAVGSLTELGTIRLGKRTEGRSPRIRDLFDLPKLDDIVFGGWDIFQEDCYAAARTAGVLEPSLLDQLRPELEAVKPMSAVFDQQYVKRLDGPNVKKGANKKDLAEQLIADIRDFKKRHDCSRLVMVWCGSTEIYMKETAVHQSVESFERGLEQNDDAIPSSMIYAYAAIREGLPYANAAPNLSADVPALLELASRTKSPLAGKDLKTGQTLMKTILAPGLKARLLGVRGWYSTNILGNRDGEVLDDPESFKTKEESKKSVLDYIFQPHLYPGLYDNLHHVVRINYYPPRGDNKEGWDNIDLVGWLGYPMQLKINFLCRDSILAAPIVLDTALFLDLAKRAGMSGIQEWLSFYFKSPMHAPGLYPEHDLFIQLMKLKNTLRYLKGEELITHLGLEYYD
jgi:myo-inositol-1-phosphate synthase